MKFFEKYSIFSNLLNESRGELEVGPTDDRHVWKIKYYDDALYTVYILESAGVYNGYTQKEVNEILDKVNIKDNYLTDDLIKYFNYEYEGDFKFIVRVIFKHNPEYFLLANGGIMPTDLTYTTIDNPGDDSVFINNKYHRSDGEWQFIEYIEEEDTDDLLTMFSSFYGFRIVWLYMLMLKHLDVLNFIIYEGTGSALIKKASDFARKHYKSVFLKINQNKDLYDRLKKLLAGKTYIDMNIFNKFYSDVKKIDQDKILSKLHPSEIISYIGLHYNIIPEDIKDKYFEIADKENLSKTPLTTFDEMQRMFHFLALNKVIPKKIKDKYANILNAKFLPKLVPDENTRGTSLSGYLISYDDYFNQYPDIKLKYYRVLDKEYLSKLDTTKLTKFVKSFYRYLTPELKEKYKANKSYGDYGFFDNKK